MGHIPKGLGVEPATMSDRSLTLLALHLQDASIQIGPKRIDRSSSDDESDESPAEPSADESTGGQSASPIAAFVALIVVLVTIAAIVGRVRGSVADEIELEDEQSGD
jgi:hypothetical protein